MTFLLNEDAAVKELLKGITVSDQANPNRPVAVFYGQPDLAIRQQSYPYITIELIDVSEANDRAHRGYVETSYIPEGATEVAKTWYPIPVNLDYQITTYCRYPQHDRQIIATLLSPGYIPFRFGQLLIPQDGTARRVDFLGYVKRDRTEQDKRLFSNVYTIRVYSELLPDVLDKIYPVTQPPNISITASLPDKETIRFSV
jgi:hypothetical protein